MMNIYDWFLRCFEIPGESGFEGRRAKIWLSQHIWTGILCVCSFPLMATKTPFNVSLLLAIVESGVGIGVILTLRRVPNAWMLAAIIWQCVVIAIADLGAVTLNNDRWWPLFILILDLLLVSREREKAMCVMGFVVFWLALVSAEQAFRFGFFDIPSFLPSYERRSDKFCSSRSAAACEKPPCAVPTRVIVDLPVQLVIFLLDFVLTRGFADRAMSEKARMEASVDTANDIASALAAFDLSRARETLNAASAGNLPEELAHALEQLLENLTIYRPYLPDALFDVKEEPGLEPAAHCDDPPPGVETVGPDGTSIATIVFTDIVQSTATWNACPDGMKRALQLHNVLIRSALAAFGGYEVKTIGDSFMAAFSSPQDAAKFSLSVHAKLYSANWPSQLLAIPHCSVVPSTWCGLRVRIGMHQGIVSVEKNTVTDRFDYFGPTVNMAARLESHCLPGCVAVLPEFAAEVEKVWTGRKCSTPFLDSTRSESNASTGNGCKMASFARERLSFCMDDWQTAVAVQNKTATLKGIGKVTLVVFTPTVLSARLKTRDNSTGEATDWVREESQAVVSAGSHRTIAAPCWMLEVIANATVASVTLAMLDHNTPVDKFRKVADAALESAVQGINKTEGTLMTVLGNAVFISWNASRRVPGHFQNCLHFTRSIHREVSSRLRTHISSGRVLAGSVGTEGQRFFTVFGECIGLARSLAASAVHVDALYCPYDSSAIEGRQRRTLRPVGWCRLPADYDETTQFIVYQVALQQDGLDENFQRIREDWGWSPEYWSLFLCRDFSSIRKRLADDADPALQRAIAAWTNVSALRDEVSEFASDT
ncbi:hypothetical protein DIPPA_51837 [Diplonema papillatum]|nr:hypothetical protein DIPPA_51837 [Diplonema papillatum]